MEFSWFFLWLGMALLGLGALLLRAWWRERRFAGAALTLSAGLLLVASAVQQLLIFGMDLSGRWSVDSTPFITLSVLAAGLATVVWLALATRRGRESLRRGASRSQRIQELEVLGAIARLSSRAGPVEQVGGDILESAAPAVGADAAVLLLYDAEHRILRAAAASGIREELWTTFEIEVSDAFNQVFLAQGKPLVVDDIANERRLKMQLARAVGARSALVVPIRYEGRSVGTLTFYAVAAPRRFDAVSVAVAELIANEAGDVLERMRLQEEVHEERERATRVLAHIGDGVFFVDGGGVIRLWNPAIAAVTGIATADALGRRPRDVLPGWAAIEALVPVASAPAYAAKHAETVPLDVGDRELWISISAVQFPDGTVYALRDLTEERGIERLKSEFVATVSHELRTPLAAVYGAAMTLRRQDLELDEDHRRRLLAVIAGESDRLARIVDQVLAASRLDSGTFAFAVEHCEPGALALQVVEAARAHAPAGVLIELAPGNDLPPVAADPDMLRQVLANLVENAVKYSPAGGRVLVSLGRHEGRVLFAVRDEGLGIPLREQERIFEKFFRLDPNLTRGVGGTGLGLYICRELVRRMGGRIWVASREGEGSTFFFELPAVAAEEPAAIPASERGQAEARAS
ncbi:MAG TPA: ATP-binding protein [Gaiellaceae bacterium]|nr:ATP-binding protein [Gaiellaceae bacterium]